MTLSEATAAAGSPIVAMRGPSETCVYARSEGGPDGVFFMFVSGRLARVDVTGGVVKTLSGAAVGDTEAEVQARYAGRLQVSPHKYGRSGHYLTYVPSDAAYAGSLMIFETDGSTVTSFRAGAVPAVSFVEGCS